jgi:hypothetical protein
MDTPCFFLRSALLDARADYNTGIREMQGEFCDVFYQKFKYCLADIIVYMRVRQIAPFYRIRPLRSNSTDAAYWRSRPYEERLAALEQIRNEYHTWKGDVQPGLQRVYTIVKRK